MIKVLRQMEEKEMNLTKILDEEEVEREKEKPCCAERKANEGQEEEPPAAFEVIMDLLVESWELSLGLAVAMGVMCFIGFRIGYLLGYTVNEGVPKVRTPAVNGSEPLGPHSDL